MRQSNITNFKDRFGARTDLLRFSKYLIAFVFFAAIVGALTYIYFQHYGIHIAKNTIKSVSEFDLSGYDFGIVAVAVSFAGVYISIVPDRCTSQMLQAVEDHFIPDPFSDRDRMSSICHPSNCPPAAVRTDAIRGIHSLIGLKRWVALSVVQRSVYVGHEGLDPHDGWFKDAYLFFQTQRDRHNIVALAVTISIAYIFVPASYLFESEKLPSTTLGTIYVLCIIEMILCITCFGFRQFFMYQFEKRFTEWRGQISNFMLANLVTNIGAANPGNVQVPDPNRPAQNGP